jgi:3-hydroxyisobutyrate dehydrogenase-like beta-hydroxyacid dehydrogenase
MQHSASDSAGQVTVAVLGAGSPMGFAMACNLARAGIGVRAWNRSPGKAAPLAGDSRVGHQAARPARRVGRARVRARPLAQPVLDILGSRTLWLGDAGAGAALKLVVNSWVLAVVEAGADTIALAEGLGLSQASFLEALEGDPLDLAYLRMKASAIANHDFEPAFRLSLAAKDARLVETAAARRHLDLPLVRVVRLRLDQGAERYGDADFCATYLTSAPRPA